jgi:hypothetical protein
LSKDHASCTRLRARDLAFERETEGRAAAPAQQLESVGARHLQIRDGYLWPLAAKA